MGPRGTGFCYGLTHRGDGIRVGEIAGQLLPFLNLGLAKMPLESLSTIFPVFDDQSAVHTALEAPVLSLKTILREASGSHGQALAALYLRPVMRSQHDAMRVVAPRYRNACD